MFSHRELHRIQTISLPMVRECESIAKQKLFEHRRAPNQLTILNRVLMENRVYSEFIVIVIGENCP